MWTLDELVDRVGDALAAEYPGAPNGRVRDVPDRRAIRWYRTIGLVDPPLGMRGRVAHYGPRHLLQLVAIKRRQAAGRTLAEIQAELTGASDEALAGVARVPEALLASDSAEPALPAGPPRARFWAAPALAPTALDSAGDNPSAAQSATAPPSAERRAAAPPLTPDPAAGPGSAADAGGAPPASASRPGAARASGSPSASAAASAAAAADAAGAVADAAGAVADAAGAVADAAGAAADAAGAVAVGGVRLGGGAILVVPGVPSVADRVAIAAAAAPLVELLAARGLLDVWNTEDGSPS